MSIKNIFSTKIYKETVCLFNSCLYMTFSWLFLRNSKTKQTNKDIWQVVTNRCLILFCYGLMILRNLQDTFIGCLCILAISKFFVQFQVLIIVEELKSIIIFWGVVNQLHILAKNYQRKWRKEHATNSISALIRYTLLHISIWTLVLYYQVNHVYKWQLNMPSPNTVSTIWHAKCLIISLQILSGKIHLYINVSMILNM